jgi:hypothetical protein
MSKLINITPENFRCTLGACPAVYTDLTPAEHRCEISVSCPAVLRTEGRYVIIGKRLDPEAEGLSGKVGEGEEAVEISAEILLSALGITGPWTPEMRRAAMKDASNICALVEAANSFIGEIEDTPLASCREIEGLTSFNVLRNLVNRIKGGVNG